MWVFSCSGLIGLTLNTVMLKTLDSLYPASILFLTMGIMSLAQWVGQHGPCEAMTDPSRETGGY